jgi:hypothetical protein
MNRQDVALVPLGQMSEESGRFWLSIVGVRGRAALAASYGSSGAVAKLCITLGPFRLTYQPTIFAGGHLTLG